MQPFVVCIIWVYPAKNRLKDRSGDIKEQMVKKVTWFSGRKKAGGQRYISLPEGEPAKEKTAAALYKKTCKASRNRKLPQGCKIRLVTYNTTDSQPQMVKCTRLTRPAAQDIDTKENEFHTDQKSPPASATCIAAS